jgi:hypothetical protein
MYKKILNKKFYVDETKNTCVCVLEFGIVPQNFLDEEVLSKYASKCKQADKVKTYLQKFEVRGIAKCSPEDTFDNRIGTDIAEFRAEKEMARIEREILTNMIRKVDILREEYEYMWNKSSMFSETRKFNLEVLCKPNKEEEE